MSALPQFILLKSKANNKYLRYHVSKKNQDSKHSFLKFSHYLKEQPQEQKVELSSLSENIGQLSDSEIKSKLCKYVKEWEAELQSRETCDPDFTSEKIDFHHLKFEVEKAKTVEGFVHIRTCYNNKYWVRKSGDSNRIVAEAHEPKEDLSKWDCTLFKPILLDANADDDVSPTTSERKIHLLHAGQHRVGLSMQDNEFHLAVVEQESPDSESGSVFALSDATPMATLPEFVAFMGHNGKYLAVSQDGQSLEFKASDIGEPGVAQRISYTSDHEHEMHITDHATNRDWIWNGFLTTKALPEGIEYTIMSSFSPIRVGSHIALKLTYLKLFANSQHIDNDDREILECNISTITPTVMLSVAEPVRVREITDATYNLNDSRIYGTSSVEKYNDSRSNYTSVEHSGVFEVEYKLIHNMSWKQDVTVNIGVSASWSFGFPYIGDFGIDVSYDRSDTWEWGKQTTEEKTVKYTQNIRMPPGKKVTMKVVAMKAYCDVPFTCKVRDLMTDGTLRDYTKTDGLFVGCNEFQFKTILTEEDL